MKLYRKKIKFGDVSNHGPSREGPAYINYKKRIEEIEKLKQKNFKNVGVIRWKTFLLRKGKTISKLRGIIINDISKINK